MTMSKVLGGGFPEREDEEAAERTGPDPVLKYDTFIAHLERVFDPKDHGRSNTRTLIELASGLFFDGFYDASVTRETFADELSKRLKSSAGAGYDADPLVKALYLVAGELLGLMHEVRRKRYLAELTEKRL